MNSATNAQIESLNRSLGVNVSNLFDYHDGFSFTVKTELEAYKAAHKYQNLRTVVRFAPNVSMWSVQIYKTEI